MGFVEELAKLQQLKLDGALTEDEFAAAKRKLLAEDTERPAGAATPVAVQLDLRDELDEVVDTESTLGGAANRYVDYKFVSLIIGAVLFIIMLIFMATTFNRAQNDFNNQFNGVNDRFDNLRRQHETPLPFDR